MSSPITGFSGYNSGLPIDDIVAKLIAADRKPADILASQKTTLTKQQSLYTTVQNKVNDLLTSIKKLTNRNFDGTTIFENRTTASSNTAIATASATGKASPQTINLEVKTLPTATRSTSTAGVGKFDNSTTMTELGVTAGNFTIYGNGTAYTVAVAANDTVGNVLNAINAAVPDGVIQNNPTIVDGKINIAYEGGAATKIVMGSGGDTSNFLSITHLLTGINDQSATITASQRNTTIDLNQTVSSAAANIATPVTDGTFFLNGVSFDTTGKSLSQIIDDINNSAAKITASFNKGNNTLELKANDTGSSLITLGGGSGNFLTAMNLVSSADTTTSQTAGTNAEFVLNGTTMYATSTTLDETVTGLSGVTLNLKQAQVGTTMQLTVQKDTDSVKAAVKDVVDKYNAAINYIDQQTDAKNKAPLSGEVRLKSLRNQIRGLFTSQVGALGSTAYDSLQQVGISTGAVGSTSGTATPNLQLDESKLLAALTADANSVKKLFIGQDLGGTMNGTTGDDNMEGSFTKILHTLADQTYIDGSGNTGYGALYLGTDDSNKGLFAAYQSRAQKRITDLNNSIQKIEDRLAIKEKTLRKQFLAMDKMIGIYQSQGSALNGLMQQFSNSQK